MKLFRFLGLPCLVVGLLFAGRARGEDPAATRLSLEAYSILNRACFECHGPARQDGSLRLDSREALLAGGDSGPSVDLEHLSTSELLRRIKLPKSDSDVMPKRGDVLTKAEIAKIEKWLAAGALWSENAAKQTHWSYVVPKKVPLPQVTTATPSGTSRTSKEFSPPSPRLRGEEPGVRGPCF